ncbi:hypothetical protein FXO38_27157 [Capsicum annuum]|nr:hypothetical protein FXO38_27157 [Capsicum annuum]
MCNSLKDFSETKDDAQTSKEDHNPRQHGRSLCRDDAVKLIRKSKLENHHNAGKTPDDAFTAVFGNEKPGRVRVIMAVRGGVVKYIRSPKINGNMNNNKTSTHDDVAVLGGVLENSVSYATVDRRDMLLQGKILKVSTPLLERYQPVLVSKNEEINWRRTINY